MIPRIKEILNSDKISKWYYFYTLKPNKIKYTVLPSYNELFLYTINHAPKLNDNYFSIKVKEIEFITELDKYIMNISLPDSSYWNLDVNNQVLYHKIDNGILIDTEIDMKSMNYLRMKIIKKNKIILY